VAFIGTKYGTSAQLILGLSRRTLIAGGTTPCSNQAFDQLIFFWITEVTVIATI
jgi:hypothetical protein